MNILAFRLARAPFAAALMLGAIQVAGAQEIDYPVDTITLVTHSSPGGGTDVFLRQMAPAIGKALGVDIAVQNTTGGASAKAMAEVAQAKPDGSKFYGTTPSFVNTSLLSHPRYSVDDLEPVVNVFLDPELLYTRTESPFKTVQDVIKASKENPKAVKFGVSTAASLDRQAIEKFKKLAGIDVGVVTHDGGGDLLIDVLNGTVEAAVGEVEELRGQIAAGKVRLLGVFTEKRLEEYPDLPTVKEQGIDLIVRKFRGIAGPKNLPDNVIEAWEKAIPKVLEDPDFKKWYKESALIPTYMNHDEYTKFMADYVQDQRDFFKSYGVTGD